MACKCTGDWSATLNRQPIEPHKLTVTGFATCDDGSADPYLDEAKPQGTVAQELILELKYQNVAESTGKPVPVRPFEKQPSPDYKTVYIRNCDKRINVQAVD